MLAIKINPRTGDALAPDSLGYQNKSIARRAIATLYYFDKTLLQIMGKKHGPAGVQTPAYILKWFKTHSEDRYL